MQDKNKFYIFYFCSTFFIFITTNFLSDIQLINEFGQKDIEQYYLIADAAPNLPISNSNILAHVSSRYAIPYLAGLISYIFNIDNFISFKILNLLFFIFFILTINFFLKNINWDFKKKLLFFSLIFFNPYIIRHHIFQPVQAHDLLFFSLTIIFLFGLIKNNYKAILISSIIMIFIRQTSFAFFFGGVFFLYFQTNRDYKKIIFFIFSFLCIFKLNSLIGNSISTNFFSYKYAYGIFLFDYYKTDELIKFLLLPFLSFFPLLLLIFFSFKVSNKTNIILCLTCFIIASMMIGQPILGGPNFTQRNVIRIATLSYVISSFFVLYTFDHKKILNNNIIYFIFMTGLVLWSFHPLYSKIKIFAVLRF